MRWKMNVLATLSLILMAGSAESQSRFVLENLGTNVNSVHHEYKPIVSADGRTLYFVRDGHPQSTSTGEDIWTSVKGPDGNWQKAVPLGPSINNPRNNGVLAVGADNNQILVCQSSIDPANLLAIALRDADGWKVRNDIVIENYYNKSKYFDFCLSQDNQFLIAAIARDDAIGGQDLYVCFRLSDNRYDTPKHLGSLVNTWGAEVSPFLAADNKTLYFTSHGHPGKGAGDIFMTRRLDDSWTSWSQPENLGDSVNSDGLDACFTIAASGNEGYLISTKNSIGQGDIFSVRVPSKAKPLPVVLVSGRVLNRKNSTPLTAEIRYYDLSEDSLIGSAVSDPRTGQYSIVLQSGRKYSFRAEVPGFFAINENLDLSILKEYREVAKDLMLAPIEKGQTIRLNNLFFDTGRTDLRPESRSELNRVVGLMRENPSLSITIEGHTDAVGEDAANLTLSEQRAKAVKDFLVTAGIPSGRLKSRGFGRAKPVGSNETEDGRAQNRRVEFTIGD